MVKNWRENFSLNSSNARLRSSLGMAIAAPCRIGRIVTLESMTPSSFFVEVDTIIGNRQIGSRNAIADIGIYLVILVRIAIDDTPETNSAARNLSRQSICHLSTQTETVIVDCRIAVLSQLIPTRANSPVCSLVFLEIEKELATLLLYSASVSTIVGI